MSDVERWRPMARQLVEQRFPDASKEDQDRGVEKILNELRLESAEWIWP